MGFTDGDMQLCESRGYSPDDVWAEVKNLMDMGLATEGSVRGVFFNEARI